MAPRCPWRNSDNVDVQYELFELTQSNQALQQIMNEILYRIPASSNQSQGRAAITTVRIMAMKPVQLTQVLFPNFLLLFNGLWTAWCGH
ncbi:hypothetical protein FH972_019858 [Carpinus fangiana]|uniref:Uncharacterized protein n=1 Tax=Carpinus fangiana TaxID=176857 RepID=A0A5N6RUN1_9ROSI|nr:hypothetical protein FH972_019858 [Carpinus fangiana]